MPTTNERVLRAIGEAVDELNRGLPRERRAQKGPESALYSESGSLDSLSLATLVVLTEMKLEKEFGCTISLADEKAMSQRRSPFRTVGSMAEYATLLLEENGHF